MLTDTPTTDSALGALADRHADINADRIFDLDRLDALSRALDGRTIVCTGGVFDLLHPAHVAYLETLARHGEALVVSVIPDARVRARKGDSRPVMTQGERARMLAALRCVSAVVTPPDEDTDEDAFVIAAALRPRFWAVVDEGWEAARARFAETGTELLVTGELAGISTSQIIRRITGA